MVTKNFDDNQSANLGRASKNDCISCENYKRKVKEVENTVSGRDVLIQMLQHEIKKVEDLYKNSIDEYEKLRFLHCSTVQELSNLKEIHRKLESDNDKLARERDIFKNGKTQLEELQTEVEKWKNKYEEIENNQCSAGNRKISVVKQESSSHKNILKEVINIEKIIQDQNQSVKDLLVKLLNEVKYSKDGKGNLDGIEEQLRKSLQDNKETSKNEKNTKDLLATIDEQSKQIGDLKNIVIKLKEENITIKNQITGKKSCLSTCLSVLDKSHTDINSLSESIETIVKEKDLLLKEIESLKNSIDQARMELSKKDQEICELKNKLDVNSKENNNEKLFKDNVDLIIELTECKKNCEKLQIEFLKKQSQVKDAEESNSVLGETLLIVTDENKSNLKKIADLNKDITNINKEYSKCICESQEKIDELENELEICTTELKSYKANPTDEDVTSITHYVKNTSQQTQSDVETRNLHNVDKNYIDQIHKLNKEINSLEGQVTEVTAENAEYEEENKYYCQKIDSLLNELRAAEQEKSKNGYHNVDCCKRIDSLKEEYENISKQKDNEIKSLKEEINELKKSHQNYPSNDLLNEDLKKKIVIVENDLLQAREEKLNVENENRKLTDEINVLQIEVCKFHKQIEAEILQLQNKIDILEKQNIQKTAELSNCCDLIKNIKKTVHDQNSTNENFLLQIKNLEGDKALLRQKISDLNCERRNVMKDMMALREKNTEYEKSFEECQCNEMVDKYEETINDLQLTNDKLKTENKTMTIEICQKECMVKHLEQCIDKSKKILEECEKQMREMHNETENLKKDNDLLKTNLEKYVYEAEVNKALKLNLQEKLSQIQKQNQLLHSEKVDLYKRVEDSSNIANNLDDLQQEHDKVVQENKEKNMELLNLKSKLESLELSCRTSKEEYEKLKMAYKDIKALLAQQIKKFNSEIRTSEEDIDNENRLPCASEVKTRPCLEKYIEGLELKVQEKDTKINFLMRKNSDISHELTHINDYVQKLILENNNLKKSTQHLINTLVQKLKVLTEIGEDSSAESIAAEIFESLTELEKQIIPTISATSSSVERCNCMSIIMSKYKLEKDDPVLKNLVTGDFNCKMSIKDLQKFEDMVIGRSSEILNICDGCCCEPSENSDRKISDQKSFCNCGKDHSVPADKFITN